MISGVSCSMLVTHIVPSATSPAFDSLPVYSMRFAYLACSDDAGAKMSVAESTARPARSSVFFVDVTDQGALSGKGP